MIKILNIGWQLARPPPPPGGGALGPALFHGPRHVSCSNKCILHCPLHNTVLHPILRARMRTYTILCMLRTGCERVAGHFKDKIIGYLDWDTSSAFR